MLWKHIYASAMRSNARHVPIKVQHGSCVLKPRLYQMSEFVIIIIIRCYHGNPWKLPRKVEQTRCREEKQRSVDTCHADIVAATIDRSTSEQQKEASAIQEEKQNQKLKDGRLVRGREVMMKRFVEGLQVEEPVVVRGGRRIVADANEEVEMSRSSRTRDVLVPISICGLIGGGVKPTNGRLEETERRTDAQSNLDVGTSYNCLVSWHIFICATKIIFSQRWNKMPHQTGPYTWTALLTMPTYRAT